jgi:hypothetical protein
MMYHGDDPRPQDQATDTAMTALYRQLDQLDLPTDTPFDTAAGLRDLTGRIHRELAGRIPQPAHIVQADRADSNTARPAKDSHKPGLAPGSPRTSTVFFAGITAMAIATMTLIAAHPASLAAIIAITVVNATTATAGTLIHRTAAARRSGGYAPARDSTTPGTQAAGPTPASIHIRTLNGNLTLAQTPPGTDRQPARLHHRAITAVLATLTIVTVAASAIGIAGMLAQGTLTGYEITLLAPTAASIILLLNTWWWRTTDRPAPPTTSTPAPTTDNTARADSIDRPEST